MAVFDWDRREYGCAFRCELLRALGQTGRQPRVLRSDRLHKQCTATSPEPSRYRLTPGEFSMNAIFAGLSWSQSKITSISREHMIFLQTGISRLQMV